MEDYVALLRGVNVGGITIRSADLKAVFVGLGFDGVRTFLASGNVRFAAPAGDLVALKGRIEQALRERFGYDAWIVLRTRDELLAALASFPFDASDPARQPYLVFCADEETRAALLAFAEGLDAGADPVAPGPGVFCWNPARGESLGTPFAKEIGRARWKPAITTRNLRTIQKIVA